MNKKFSTLIASLLLAGAMGTVDAANYAKFTTAPVAAEVVKTGTFYQLETSTTGSVLSMFRDANGEYRLKVVAANSSSTDEIRSTLWTIMPQQNAEGGYSYVFVNYASGLQLAVNSQGAAVVKNAGGAFATPAGSIAVGGDVNIWKWVPAPNPVSKTFSEATVSAAFGANRDSVLVLTVNGANVGAEKYALKNVPSSLITNALQVKPASPAAIVLGVDDLNSMLWKGNKDGKLKLTFTEDVKGGDPAAVNLFTKQAYKAVAPVGFPANYTFAGESGKAAYPDADANLTAKYQAMATAEIDYKEDLAIETFGKAIQAILDADKGYDINHAAVWAAYAGLGANVTGIDNATKEEVAAKVNQVTLDQVKTAAAAADVTDLDKVTDKTLEDVLGKVKAAVNALVYAHPAVDYNIAKAAQGYSQAVATLDELVKANANYANVVKGYVADTKATKEVLDAAMTAAENVFVANAGGAGWVSLQANSDLEETPAYLAVDTAFLTSAAGAKHLAFAIKNFKDVNVRAGAEDRTRMDLNGRFNFQFVWHPSSDSIVIRTAGFAKKQDDTKYWTQMTSTSNPLDLGMWKANEAAKETTNGTKVAISASNLPFEQNLIKIAVLADNHREVTVGSSEFQSGFTPNSTINTKITINAASQYELTTLPSGIYFFNLSTNMASKKYDDGKYYVARFCGDNGIDYEAEEVSQKYGVAQDFGHMPRTQWVVVQNPGVTGQQTVSIYNREFEDIKYENIQLYKGGNSKVFAQYGFTTDTLAYALAKDVKPNAGILTDKYLGYKAVTNNGYTSNRVTLDYFSGLEIGHFVNVSSTVNDTTVYVDANDAYTTFQLIPVEDVDNDNSIDYTYGKAIAGIAPQLYRQLYTVKVYDSSKLNNNAKYIVRAVNNENTYAVSYDPAKAVKFYLKENNQIVAEENDTTCYYALVDVENAARVGVRDVSLKFTIEGVCSEQRVATFAVRDDQTVIYRELNGDNTAVIEAGVETFVAPTVANFYRSRIVDKQYLFESAYQSQFNETGKGINYLGVRMQDATFNDSTAIYVDTADVRNPFRPQYMLAVGVEAIAAGKYCPIHGFNAGCKEEHLLDVPAQVWGRYLINAQDSLDNVKAFGGNGVKDVRYQWENQYTRLAFVHAMHVGDTLVIFRDGQYPLTKEGHKDYLTAIEWARAAAADKVTPGMSDRVYVMNVKDRNGDNEKNAFAQDYANYKFMFRLVDDQDKRDFIIESHDCAFGLENNTYPKAENETEYRAIKVQNGVPVIARHKTAEEGILNSEWWNIDQRKTDPTANEAIDATEVSVVATTGAIVVKGAEGKKIVVSNVLGKTIADAVITSDYETISVPAGIVVVSVEGEDAVKAVVK